MNVDCHDYSITLSNLNCSIVVFVDRIYSTVPKERCQSETPLENWTCGVWVRCLNSTSTMTAKKTRWASSRSGKMSSHRLVYGETCGGGFEKSSAMGNHQYIPPGTKLVKNYLKHSCLNLQVESHILVWLILFHCLICTTLIEYIPTIPCFSSSWWIRAKKVHTLTSCAWVLMSLPGDGKAKYNKMYTTPKRVIKYDLGFILFYVVTLTVCLNVHSN